MYKTQTRRSHLIEVLLTAVLPPLVIVLMITGTFAFVSHTEGMPFTVDVPFTVGAFLVTLLLSAGAAVCDYLEGPGMVKMSPAEEAAKREEIRVDVEARMAPYDWTKDAGVVEAFRLDRPGNHSIGNLPMTRPSTEVERPLTREERYHGHNGIGR